MTDTEGITNFRGLSSFPCKKELNHTEQHLSNVFTHQHQGAQLKLSEAAELARVLLQASLSFREHEFYR
jgi:hypothetical protein